MSYTIPIRFISFLVISILPSLASSQSVLKGKIKWNPKWENKIFISPLNDFEFEPKATDSIMINRDGSFYYQLPQKNADLLLFRLQIPPRHGRSNYIIEGPAENTLYIYLPAKGIVQLIADADSFYYSAKILAGGINNKLLKYREYKKPFRDMQLKVQKKITAFPDSAEQYKAQIYEEWMKEIDLFKGRVKKEIIRSEDPATILLGLYNYYMANLGRYDSAFFSQTINRMKDQQMPLVKKLKKDLKAVKNNRIGVVFPGLLMEDESGNKKSIRDFKGKYIVIDFWTSWCTPCRLSIRSHLPKLYNEIKQKNIVLLGISADENKGLWKKALQVDKPSWPQLHDGGQNASCHEFFQIAAYPTLLVLNENYEVIFETSADFELETFLKKLTKE